jgi:hypothetical protein
VAATRSPVVAHPDRCGLFAGAEAVAFTLHTANHPGYQAALGTLDSHITAVTRVRLERAHARLDRGELPELGEFDLIGGLTGPAPTSCTDTAVETSCGRSWPTWCA